MKGKEYAGWANLETGAVARWIDKDALSRQHWREAAAEARREAANCPKAAESTREIGEASRLLLADWLKEEIQDRFPLSEADIYTDLLNSALAKVRWAEIAAALLANIDDETQDTNAGENVLTTSAEAVEQGVLVDVTEAAKKVGIKFSVAVTSAVWSQCVEVPNGAQGQDGQGRLRDILQMLRHTISLGQRKYTKPLDFLLKADDDEQQPQIVTLKALWGSGDETEPVVAIMLPNEH